MLLEKELITEAIVDNLLSWPHSGFSAHVAVRVEDRAGAIALLLGKPIPYSASRHQLSIRLIAVG